MSEGPQDADIIWSGTDALSGSTIRHWARRIAQRATTFAIDDPGFRELGNEYESMNPLERVWIWNVVIAGINSAPTREEHDAGRDRIKMFHLMVGQRVVVAANPNAEMIDTDPCCRAVSVMHNIGWGALGLPQLED